MIGGMGLISVPNSCSTRYLQDRAERLTTQRPIDGYTTSLTTVHTASQHAHQLMHHQHLQVEAVFIRDKVHCKTQVPKPARPAHLKNAVNVHQRMASMLLAPIPLQRVIAEHSKAGAIVPCADRSQSSWESQS